MTSKHCTLRVSARVALTLAAGFAGSLLLAGCGLGDAPISNSTLSAASFSGKINGGPNPIVGATVKLYTTGTGPGNATNGGYGVGSFVQEANAVSGPGRDTAADGSFTFAGGYPCPSGQFLYIVSAGGDTGAGFNAKTFLVSALGRCDDLFSGGQYIGGFIYLNELSTVAAAYALGNFTTITGQGFFAQVGIGAPSSNNAVNGCVANGTSCTTTAEAGLRHAFQNAGNLKNPFSPVANSTLPQNASAQVPLQLINSIANTVVSCVNSNGNSNACRVLFGATNTDFSNGNTFQALVNLAKNPKLTGTPFSTSDFLAAATPQTSFYQPSLAFAPQDFSIAIYYPKLTGKTTGAQGLTFPFSGSLDINDNYYIGNYDSAALASSNLASFNSNGTLVSFTPDSTTLVAASGVSADAIGDVYSVGFTPNQGGNIDRFLIDNVTGAIVPSPTSRGIGTPQPISSAVDRQNNLWVGTQSNAAIIEVAANGTLPFIAGVNAPVNAVAVDPDQNIWVTNSSATNPAANAILVVQNTGTTAAPSYSTSNILGASIPNLGVSGVSFVTASPYSAYIANSSSTPGLTLVVPTVSGAEVTNLNVGTATSVGNGPVNNQTDGNGVIWAADGADIVEFTPTASVVTRLTPCRLGSISTRQCEGVPYAGIQSVSIDSAGSVWFLASGTGSASEMIGAAAPTVPLLSLGVLGKP
ncbi:MAG: hypothetical protein ABI147_13285 [Acidobacteriaceae bacterium]